MLVKTEKIEVPITEPDCPWCDAATNESCRHRAARWVEGKGWTGWQDNAGAYGNTLNSLADRISTLLRYGWSPDRIETAPLMPRIVNLLRTAMWTAERSIVEHRNEIDLVSGRAHPHPAALGPIKNGTPRQICVYHLFPWAAVHGFKEWVASASNWLDDEERLFLE